MSYQSGTRRVAGSPRGGALRERTLGVRHAVVTSLAVVTPTAAIFFLTIPVAANAGRAMPLAYLIAFVVVLLIVNAIYSFTQRVAHAGSFFAFANAGIGPRAGFLSGWLFLAFYPLVQVFSLVIFGAFVSQILEQHASIQLEWWVITVVGLVFIWGMSVLGIRLTIRTDLAFLLFEGAVLVALAITILVNGGAHGDWHGSVFDPSGMKAGGIALAAVFGIQSFTGFEAASYLGEETSQPRRTIPRGIIITTLLVGAVYVFFSYIATIGWGVNHMAAYGKNPAPWDVLATRYWSSSASVVIDVAAAIAALAGGMASQNGAARMLFALGRDGMLPSVLSRVNSRFGTPAIALSTLLVFALAVALGLGVGYGPLRAFEMLGLVVTFSALAVYFLVQIACINYFRRLKQFKVLWHGLVPLVAMAVIVYLFVKTEFPAPPHPLDLAIWIAIGWAVVGIAMIATMSARAPERFARITRIIGIDEPGELLASEGASAAAPAPAVEMAPMSAGGTLPSSPTGDGGRDRGGRAGG
ncbi:MAG: APC family permease [Solirubrobacteraceae bacterium]